MDFVFTNLCHLPPTTRQEVADRVAALSRGVNGESPQMLPVQAGDLLERPYGVVAFGARDAQQIEVEGYRFAGFVSALTALSHNKRPMSEVGTLVVEPSFRRYGLGTELVTRITQSLHGTGVDGYAFANPSSFGAFSNARFRVARPTEIPGAAFEACLSCPALPSSGCCDTIMIKASGQ